MRPLLGGQPVGDLLVGGPSGEVVAHHVAESDELGVGPRAGYIRVVAVDLGQIGGVGRRGWPGAAAAAAREGDDQRERRDPRSWDHRQEPTPLIPHRYVV